MQIPEYHKHPDSGVLIHGICIDPGMRLWASDRYASLRGVWEENPFPPGVMLLENDEGRWVRPVPEGVTSIAEYVPRWYFHPLSSRPILGTIIVPGTVLLPGDVYSAKSGDWEACYCAGEVFESLKNGEYWIRPDDSRF